MELLSLPRYSLRAEECAEAIVRISDVVSVHVATERLLGLVLSHAAEVVEQAHRAFGISQANPLTRVVAEKDMKRDELFTSLGNFIRGEQSHDDPEKAAAARLLYRHFKKQGLNLVERSYAVESSRLKALFLDLMTPESQAASELLGISGRVGALINAENEFFALHQQLTHSKAQDDAPAVNEILKPLRVSLFHILAYVEIGFAMEPDNWANCVGELNEIITEFVARARARRTRRESEEPVGPEEEPSADGSGGEPDVTADNPQTVHDENIVLAEAADTGDTQKS